MRIYFVIAACFIFGAGCNTVSQFEQSRIKDEPFVIDNTYRYVKQDTTKVRQGTKQGTIWRGEATPNNFFVDQRAKGIGDIITIKITEVSEASEKATTDTGRSSAIDAGINNMMGWEVKYPSRHPSVSMDHMVKATTSNTFSGTGETKRTGSLSATISAKVVDVLPSGNLAIEGKREIYINNEKKEILLQGIVRPRDIAYDNSVLSTQVADAKVIYTGIGVIGEKQRPGWLARVFDLVWPF
ncbi:MAG: Flagellar L-ring protein precursor [Syntrophorhabdus sp. PtaU1.Bin050]|nr:MAG: Flagellar L-ring protein precursor [Syntrophorhabdus sp. PtaU1.Bin050]